jgi:hypothetical protein
MWAWKKAHVARDAAQQVVSDTHGTALGDGQRTGLDARGHPQLVVSPNDGLDQFLPVAAATEQGTSG